MNENENNIPRLMGCSKSSAKGTFIVRNAYVKKPRRPQINNLTLRKYRKTNPNAKLAEGRK